LAFALLFSCSNNTEKSKVIHIKELGWTFELQANDNFKDSSFDSNGSISKSFKKIGDNEMLSLFRIQDDPINFISCVIIKDTSDIESWKVKCQNDKDWYFRQLSLLVEKQIFNTNYYTDVISGRNFYKEYVKLFDKDLNDTIFSYHYFTKFKKYELGVNFTYTNSAFGEKYFSLLRSSKFDN
jgi:hypothetical protein